MPRPVIDRLRKDEGGFTLVELLVASMVGTVIIMSAFALIETSLRGERTVQNRLDATSRGRNAMEQITRQLRAQVCLGKSKHPMVRAEDTITTFHATVAPSPATASERHEIQQRTLEYVPDGSTGRGSIRESVVTGTGTIPDMRFDGAPRVRTIVDNVAPVPGVPMFRYFQYDPDQSPLVRQVATPASAADLRTIVQVETTFAAFPENSQDADRVSTRLDSKITVRTADPTDPTRSPQCI